MYATGKGKHDAIGIARRCHLDCIPDNCCCNRVLGGPARESNDARVFSGGVSRSLVCHRAVNGRQQHQHRAIHRGGRICLQLRHGGSQLGMAQLHRIVRAHLDIHALLHPRAHRDNARVPRAPLRRRAKKHIRMADRAQLCHRQPLPRLVWGRPRPELHLSHAHLLVGRTPRRIDRRVHHLWRPLERCVDRRFSVRLVADRRTRHLLRGAAQGRLGRHLLDRRPRPPDPSRRSPETSVDRDACPPPSARTSGTSAPINTSTSGAWRQKTSGTPRWA